MDNKENAKDAKQLANDILERSKTNENVKKIKNARFVLIIIGVINMLYGLYYYFQPYSEVLAYSSIVVGLIFIGLFFLGAKKPLLALIIGLVIFVIPHLINAISDPASIFQGIILKVIFITLIIKGIISVSKIPKKEIDQNSEILDDF